MKERTKLEIDKIKTKNNKDIERIYNMSPGEISELEENMKIYRLGCILLSIALVISILCGGL